MHLNAVQSVRFGGFHVSEKRFRDKDMIIFCLGGGPYETFSTLEMSQYRQAAPVVTCVDDHFPELTYKSPFDIRPAMMAHFGWEQDPWQQLKVSLEPKEPFKALASSLASQRELIAAFMMQNQARARALLTDLCSQMTLRPSQRNTKTDDGESKPALKESLERLRQMNIRPPYLPDEIPEDQHESVFAETKRRILDALANPLTKLTYRVMVKDDSAQETQGHLKVALEVPKVDTGLQ